MFAPMASIRALRRDSSGGCTAKILGYLDRHGMEALHSGTQIIIARGYKYRIVKAMVTNFHQPQSTLLLLVRLL